MKSTSVTEDKTNQAHKTSTARRISYGKMVLNGLELCPFLPPLASNQLSLSHFAS